MTFKRSSATAHITKKKLRYIDDKLIVIVNALRFILRPYAKDMNVRADDEHYYELWTKRGYRPKSLRIKSKQGIAFAAIIAFKKHIAFYFYPLSADAALRNNIKPELKVFHKGVYTFHLSAFDPMLAKQVEELIAEGWALYRKEGLI